MIYNKKSILSSLTLGALLIAALPTAARQTAGPAALRGTVLDENGDPLPGVVVTSEKTGQQSTTDAYGTYTITTAEAADRLTLSYLGYENTTVRAAEAKSKPVCMKCCKCPLEKEVDLGLLTMKGRAVTGAYATVSGETLDKRSEQNLAKTFAGQLAGLTTIEKKGELGYISEGSTNAAVDLYIRGVNTINGTRPLILIDGIPCTSNDYAYLTPEELESVTILKDAATTAIYGIQSANGVLSIRTKRGVEGKAQVRITVDQTMQQPTRKPTYIDSPTYARLRNEAARNDGMGDYALFSQADIDKYARGGSEAYPSHDWYDEFMHSSTWMTRAGISVRGGNKNVKYYSNVNYMHQQQAFKTADESYRKYDPTPGVDRFNFRSNIDVRLNSYLKAFMRLGGNININKTAGYSNELVRAQMIFMTPTMVGPLTPATEDSHGEVVAPDAGQYPTYGMLNRSGYIKNLTVNVNAQAGITADLNDFVKGLSLTGMMAYQTNSTGRTSTTQEFERYSLVGSPEAMQFEKKGTELNTPLSYSKSSAYYYNLDFSASAQYERTFGDHSLSALAYYLFERREVESFYGNAVLPYKRQSMGVSATYGYLDRYFLRADLGYSGSEQFHPDHRYMATPSVSAAWIVSDEAFLKQVSWIDLLKLRASYGLTANDRLGDTRMMYEDDISRDGLEGLLGNPLLSAEKIKKMNFGFDLGLVKGLSISFDWYKNTCDNMLVASSGFIPEYQGHSLANYAKLNKGSIENTGFELTAQYQKRLTKDLSFYVGGSFSVAKNKIKDCLELATDSYAYPNRLEGYSVGQLWGYEIDYSNGTGMFNTQSELDAAPAYSFGTPRLGDFVYKDLNGDKIIDEGDKAPIGYSRVPQQYYTINGGLKYKGWELNFLFQGTGKSTYQLGDLTELGLYENTGEGTFTDMHLNAWTPERYAAGQEITAPALCLKQSTSQQPNSFYLMDTSYFRLRNLEIAYTLPESVASKVFAQSIRISLSGDNLFTIDNMKTGDIDPETCQWADFPTYRAFNLGVKLTF